MEVLIPTRHGLGKLFKVKTSTVERCRNPGSGGPCIVSQLVKAAVNKQNHADGVSTVVAAVCSSVRQGTHTLSPPFCVADALTVGRFVAVPTAKLMIHDVNKTQRLEWARQYMLLDIAYMYIDETAIQLHVHRCYSCHKHGDRATKAKAR